MNSSLTVSSGGIPAIVSELLPISSQEYSGFPPYKFALKVMASSLSATDLNVADLGIPGPDLALAGSQHENA